VKGRIVTFHASLQIVPTAGKIQNTEVPDFAERPRTDRERHQMIRKLKSGEYRLYSRKVDPKSGKRRNLGTFKSRAAAEKHEREVQYFKRH
jgi:hypothetical protein